MLSPLNYSISVLACGLITVQLCQNNFCILVKSEITTPPPSPVHAPLIDSPPPLTPPTLTWGNVELPLEEEKPEESVKTKDQQLYVS